MEQCLSEHDRGILLQEIQQIQRTLEESGRNLPAGEEKNYSSSDEENGYDLYKCKQEIQSDSDENEQKDVHEGGTSSLSVSSGYIISAMGKDGVNIVDDNLSGINPGGSTGNFSSNKGQEKTVTNIETALTETTGSDSASEIIVPKSSISEKMKNRIKKESDGGSRVKTGKKSVTVLSSPNSGESSSLPTKQIEKINMANLYVERLFGAFRNKKTRPQNLFTFDEGRYGVSELKSSANLSTLENLLQVNRRYKDLLEDELKKVELAIARNTRAQEEVSVAVDDKNFIQNATFSGLSKACIGRFANPYFKDNEGMGPPDNDDTINKKRSIKVDPFIRGAKPWKSTEVAALEDGVYHNNLEKRLEVLMKKLKHFDKECKEKQKRGIQMDRTPRVEISNEIAIIKQLPQREIIIDQTDIDFFRISKNFLPTRDEFECRLQWCNVAHPLINQKQFTKDEDAIILKLSKKYNNCQWEQIAKELDTNRTPIQCLQRFQRTLNKEILKTTWDTEDDNKLTAAVSLFGSHNWVSVADFLGDRTGDQCMHRWQKTLDPNIKRGKWSNEEDQILLKAVEKYGTKNWKELKKEVPGRTDSQCRERFVSTLDPTKNWGAFTEEEDEKIIGLVRKHGVGKWSLIAKEFPSRRDNQIWRRYTQIESENYHKYRRGVIWKRKSVLNYFFHRQSERRDYGLEELDINPTPSLTTMESRKLERTREELERCGYSNEEIIRKLARMHYEGHFAKSMYKPRQRPYSQGRVQKRDGGRVQVPSKSASKELLADLQNVMLSVKDPSTELPAPPSEPLKRKTRIERDVDIEGYRRIKRPVLKQTGQKVTWLAKADDIDTFGRMCDKIIMKLVSKDISYEDARRTLDHYYGSVQQPNNDKFNTCILRIYTGVLVRYQNMVEENETFKSIIILQDEIPFLISKLESVQPKTISPRKNIKRGAKDAAFRHIVLAARRENVVSDDDGCNSVSKVVGRNSSDSILQKPTKLVKKMRTEGSHINDDLWPIPQSSLLEHEHHNPRRVSIDSQATSDSKCEFGKSNPSSSRHVLLQPISTTTTSISNLPPKLEPNIDSSENINNEEDNSDIMLNNNSNIILNNNDCSNSDSNNNSVNNINSNSLIAAKNTRHNNSMEHGINEISYNTHDTTIKEGTGFVESSPQTVLSAATATNSGTSTTQLGDNQSDSSVLQDSTNSVEDSRHTDDRASQLNHDKVNTFQLLLQALWIDTPGVMGTISGTPATNPAGMLSSVPFPTCYPLSPNSASLLGFRKLLLHRRKLGEIVREHAVNSERIGIPVLRDKSYQNTKAYDALRKRFRSIFTWPAFLATFIPKYTEKKKVRTIKTSKLTPSENKQFDKLKSTSTQISKSTSKSICTPTFTKTLVGSVSCSSSNLQLQQNSTITSTSCSSVSVSTTSPAVAHHRTTNNVAPRYVQQQKQEHQHTHKKQNNTNNTEMMDIGDRSSKRLRKRKGVLPVTITSPFKRKCLQRSPFHPSSSQETIFIDDNRTYNKRKLHTDSCSTSLSPTRIGRKVDERENNGDQIFIPPSVKLEVAEEELCTEIVDERDSPQIIA